MLITEIIAVSFGILYLLLAMRENIGCWLAGFISTLLFAGICFYSQLYMDMLLQLYYVVMSYVGWQQWRRGGVNHSTLEISSLPLIQHAIIITMIILLSLISESLLVQYTDATYPFLDSILAWGGVITTVMVTRKILENWLYWIVLDALAIGLYCSKALYLTAGLSLVYTLLACHAYYLWWRRFKTSQMIRNHV